MFITWIMILMACFTGKDQPQAAASDIVSLSVAETVVIPGKKCSVIIQVKVKDGYHIQANRVTNESLIPVKLEITADQLFTISNPVFPPCKLFQLQGTHDYLNVFDSLFIIRLPVKTATIISDGKYFIKARLRYQACDAKICLFPRTLEFEIPLVVLKNRR